jgi:hypothetical protein
MMLQLLADDASSVAGDQPHLQLLPRLKRQQVAAVLPRPAAGAGTTRTAEAVHAQYDSSPGSRFGVSAGRDVQCAVLLSGAVGRCQLTGSSDGSTQTT